MTLTPMVFHVERMYVTGKGRTWHPVCSPCSSYLLADRAANAARSFDALLVRVRPAEA